MILPPLQPVVKPPGVASRLARCARSLECVELVDRVNRLYLLVQRFYPLRVHGYEELVLLRGLQAFHVVELFEDPDGVYAEPRIAFDYDDVISALAAGLASPTPARSVLVEALGKPSLRAVAEGLRGRGLYEAALAEQHLLTVHTLGEGSKWYTPVTELTLVASLICLTGAFTVARSRSGGRRRLLAPRREKSGAVCARYRCAEPDEILGG